MVFRTESFFMSNSLVDVFSNFQLVKFWLLIFVAVNIGSAVTIWLDKRNARNGKRRISEHTLLVWAVVGGWLGGLCLMYALRHKTSKALFLGRYWLIMTIYIAGSFLIGYGMIR